MPPIDVRNRIFDIITGKDPESLEVAATPLLQCTVVGEEDAHLGGGDEPRVESACGRSGGASGLASMAAAVGQRRSAAVLGTTMSRLRTDAVPSVAAVAATDSVTDGACVVPTVVGKDENQGGDESRGESTCARSRGASGLAPMAAAVGQGRSAAVLRTIMSRLRTDAVPCVAAVAATGVTGVSTRSQANAKADGACVGSATVVAAKSAEPKAKKKGKKRKSGGGGGGGGGGRRAPKLAPLDSVRLLPEVWKKWIPKDESGSIEADSRFRVKPSLIEGAGDGLFCAQPLCKGDVLAFIATPTISSKLTTETRRAYKGFVVETVLNVDLSACEVRFACAVSTSHRGSLNDVLSLLRVHYLSRLSCDVLQPLLFEK